MKTRTYVNIWMIFAVAFIAVLLVFTACQKQEEAKSTPNFSQGALPSKTLGLDWNYEVYMPQEYKNEENKNKTYPVVYFLHGAYGSYNNWRFAADLYTQFDQLIKENKIQPFIAVCVDGFNSYYVDRKLQMDNAIINELMPYIAQKLRINTAKEQTFIGGLSMGGYGSERFALKYPEKFAGAFCLSPVCVENPETDPDSSIAYKWDLFKDVNGNFDKQSWTDNHPLSFFSSYVSKNSPVKFYIATGEADTSVYLDNVSSFVDKLDKIADVKFVTEKDGKHNWTFWTPQIIQALQYFLPAK